MYGHDADGHISGCIIVRGVGYKTCEKTSRCMCGVGGENRDDGGVRDTDSLYKTIHSNCITLHLVYNYNNTEWLCHEPSQAATIQALSHVALG